jgi:hypothetical protein
MIVFVDRLGVGGTVPMLPRCVQEAFQATGTQIAYLHSIYFAA